MSLWFIWRLGEVAFAVSFTLAVQETSGAVHPAGGENSNHPCPIIAWILQQIEDFFQKHLEQVQLLPCCLPWWKAQETIGRSAPRHLEAFFVLEGRWSDLVLVDFVWNLRESSSAPVDCVDDILSDRKHVQLRTVGGSVLMVLAWSSDRITNTACHCCYRRCIPGFLRFRTSRIKICSIKTYQLYQLYQVRHQFVWDPMIPSFIVKTSLLPRREDVALARWLFSSTISPSNGSTRRFSREGAEDVNFLLSEYVVQTSDVSSQVFFKGFGKAARLRNRWNRSEISKTCVSSCGFMLLSLLPSALFSLISLAVVVVFCTSRWSTRRGET